MMNRRRGGLRTVSRNAVATALAIGGLTVALGVPASAVGEYQPITGSVYQDTDLDGVRSDAEPPVADAEVRAFDAEGAEVGSTVTGADGTYSLGLATAHTGTVRVEFTVPTGFVGAFVSGAEGASGSSIQFVEPGSADVDFGIIDPAAACVYKLATVCLNQGHRNIAGAGRVLGLSDFSPPTVLQNGRPVAADQTSAATETLTTAQEVGATWGLGYQSSTRLLWNSAMIRRHSGLGPEGIGGVYVTDLDGNIVTSFDLIADAGLTVAADPTDYSDASRDIREAVDAVDGYPARANVLLSRDVPGFEGVGTAGLGDLDITPDGSTMFVTNLYERKIHRIELGGTASAPTLGTVTSWAVDDGYTCAQPVLRPWGLEIQSDGTVLVAAVCTNEAADPATKSLPGEGVILQLDPAGSGAAAWSEVTTFEFDHPHNYDYCDSQAGYTCTWKAWTNDWSAVKTPAEKGSQYWWTQPMILDVERLADGSFVLGISDRMSYQGGNANFGPIADSATFPGYMTTWVAGDTLLLCKTETGWLKETGGACAGTTNYDSARTNEFFQDDFGHPETTIGGLALGGAQVAVGAMDPAAYFLSGVRWVSTGDGDQTNALNLTAAASSINDGFGKAAAVGDVEAICDQTPLQIGNRVWYDFDNDGIQDPDEPPVVGVTVRLYDSGGTLVGTARTNAAGEYYFTSTLTEDADGGADPDEFGGNLQPDTAYSIVIDNGDDCAEGGPLAGWLLTLQDGTTEAGPAERDDLIDSDAAPSSSYTLCTEGAPEVLVAPLAQGTVDHSFDIGFSVPSVLIGDLVWYDLDQDGEQDPDEPGAEGVTLTLQRADGSPVVDVLGRPLSVVTTDASGRYLFPLLPLGDYTVTITYPSGYGPTVGTTTETVSLDLAEYGTWDRLLDFGLIQTSVPTTTAPPTTDPGTTDPETTDPETTDPTTPTTVPIAPVLPPTGSSNTLLVWLGLGCTLAGVLMVRRRPARS